MTPDCEKYEPLLLDELYEELDEVTSAAVKRHVAGCSHCGPILNGMRSTRRAAALPMLDMPAGLEDRILASVKETERSIAPVIPISRGQRALSWAGSWAMRPQTAMAAVFLLMIGSSAFLLRARRAGPGAASEQAVSVTEKGQPGARAQAPPDHDSLDSKAAAAAHGANVPTTLPPAPVPAMQNGFSNNADPSYAGPVDNITAGKGRGGDDSNALGSALLEAQKDKAPEPKPTDGDTRGALKKESNEDISNAMAPAGAPYPPAAQTVAPNMRTAREEDGFTAGIAAYRARNFADATKKFDAAAASGDQNSALWAARSVRDGSGCAAALPRFNGVATRASGTFTGNDAILEAARCQIALGQLDDARAKLNTLVATSTHRSAAQQALGELDQTASRRAKASGSARPAPAPNQRATEKADKTEQGY